MDMKTVPADEIDLFLADLKANNHKILSCINLLRLKYDIPLLESARVVLDSKVWAMERDEWVRNHEEAEREFFDAASEEPKANRSG